MTLNQKKNHLSSTAKDNGHYNKQSLQLITEATFGLNHHYFIKLAERMSIGNAEILAKFIISNRKERNISNKTAIIYIDAIVYLENYHKHKDLNKIENGNIISFLDSYRKTDAQDPLHKWINTYNIRLDTIYRFFRWFYCRKHDGLVSEAMSESNPPILNVGNR